MLVDKEKWPKRFPPLTEEQRRISDDFMKHWHEVLPNRFGIVDRFNQNYAVKESESTPFLTTLEVGAGIGEHLKYEELTDEQKVNYVALDIRQNMVDVIRANHPTVQAICGDCQERLPFNDGHFDRVLAIHVLEHLPNLPQAVRELYRLTSKNGGRLYLVIPCEGGAAYTLARRISAQRIFEKRYGQPYRWFIEREHINLPDEILYEIGKYFDVERRTFFPLALPVKEINLCIGAVCVPKLPRDVTA